MAYQHQLSSLSDIGDFLYSLLETNEFGADIEVHDKLFNDIETDEDKWYTRLTFLEIIKITNQIHIFVS